MTIECKQGDNPHPYGLLYRGTVSAQPAHDEQDCKDTLVSCTDNNTQIYNNIAIFCVAKLVNQRRWMGKNNENQCIPQEAGGRSIHSHKIITGLDDDVEGINMFICNALIPKCLPEAAEMIA